MALTFSLRRCRLGTWSNQWLNRLSSSAETVTSDVSPLERETSTSFVDNSEWSGGGARRCLSVGGKGDHAWAWAALRGCCFHSSRGYRSRGAASTLREEKLSSLSSSSSSSPSPLLRLGANSGGVRLFRATASSSARDFYDVLGCERGASDGEIKKAYLKKAKELHPDTNTSDPEAQSKFQEVQKAYEVLKDKSKRQVYDQVGAKGYENMESGGGFGGPGGPGAGPGGMGFDQGPFGFHFRQGGQGDINLDDLFSEFFGSQMGQNPFAQRRPARGQNLAVEMAVSFTEAAFGCKKTIAVEVPVEYADRRARRAGAVKTERKEVEINIPAGVDDNETLRVRGEGSPGPKGVPPGDLMVYLRVMPHRQFRRDGHNLHLQVDISIIQAILGGTVRIPTLDEGDLQLKIRAGTQPEELQVIKGKGIPVLGARSLRSRGNLYVRFKLHTPSSLTERQREILEEFQEIEESGGGRQQSG